MIDRAASRPTPWLVAGVVISILTAAGALVACSSDGTTPKCSAVPLYDVNNPTPSDIAARKQAESEGCLTAPGDAGGTSLPDSGTD